jgi:hypothetical protein
MPQPRSGNAAAIARQPWLAPSWVTMRTSWGEGSQPQAEPIPLPASYLGAKALR